MGRESDNNREIGIERNTKGKRREIERKNVGKNDVYINIHNQVNEYEMDRACSTNAE
jgi:hypothetical protein